MNVCVCVCVCVCVRARVRANACVCVFWGGAKKQYRKTNNCFLIKISCRQFALLSSICGILFILKWLCVRVCMCMCDVCLDYEQIAVLSMFCISHSWLLANSSIRHGSYFLRRQLGGANTKGKAFQQPRSCSDKSMLPWSVLLLKRVSDLPN